MQTHLKNSRYLAHLALFFILSCSVLPSVSWANSPPVPAGSTGNVSAANTGTPSPAGSTEAVGGAAQPEPPGMGSMLLTFGLMFGVAYFLMIRPQQKKMKKHQSMLTELKRGDDIITASGIIGTVTGITDKVVTVEVAEDVRLRIIKSQISQIVKGSIQDVVTS